MPKLKNLKLVLTQAHLENHFSHVDWVSIFLDLSVRSIPPLLQTVTFIQHDGFDALHPFCSWLDRAASPLVAFCNFTPNDPVVSTLFFETHSPSWQSLAAILDAPSHPSAVINCIYPQDTKMVQNPVQHLEPDVRPLFASPVCRSTDRSFRRSPPVHLLKSTCVRR